MIPCFSLIGGMGYGEMLVVGFIALLLFGKKLPEVARSLGKGVTEFKKGIQGIEDEIRDSAYQHPELPQSTQSVAPETPKFEPPTSPPDQKSPSAAPSPESISPSGSGSASD